MVRKNNVSISLSRSELSIKNRYSAHVQPNTSTHNGNVMKYSLKMTSVRRVCAVEPNKMNNKITVEL